MRPWLPLLLTTGCSGSVKLSGIDGFGMVRSTTWVHVASHDDELDYLVVSNQSRVCHKLTQAHQAVSPLVEDFIDEHGLDLLSYCEDYPDLLDAQAEATSWLDDGSHLLALYLTHDGQWAAPPEEKTYSTDGLRHGLVGTLSYFQQNPYTLQAESWDEDACDGDSAADASHNYDLTDAQLDITLGNDRLDATLSGDLDGGTIEADFAAARCDIEVDSDHIWF